MPRIAQHAICRTQVRLGSARSSFGVGIRSGRERRAQLEMLVRRRDEVSRLVSRHGPWMFIGSLEIKSSLSCWTTQPGSRGR